MDVVIFILRKVRIRSLEERAVSGISLATDVVSEKCWASEGVALGGSARDAVLVMTFFLGVFERNGRRSL